MKDLVALTANRTPRDLSHEPQGEWSAAQVAAHMADNEIVYAVRVRMILTDENPLAGRLRRAGLVGSG